MSTRSGTAILGTAVGVAALAALAVQRRPVDFTNKVVLITGGSRGLGLVMARQFAEAGAQIAICARDQEEINRAVADLESRGASVFSPVCDVRNQAEAERLIEGVVDRFGKIDILVNNAGIIQVGPLAVQTQKDFEDSMAVHFWGPFYLIQAALPKMKEQGEGRIVNIVSIGGKIAVPHLAPYSAGKFALAGLSEGISHELAKENIWVTSVYPGLMRTGSHINALFKGQNEAEFALFSMADALPISSVSAESAAEQILRATYNRDAELIISPQAKLAAKVKELFPELTATLLSLINRMLPAEGGIGTGYATGLESRSEWLPPFLTAGIDAASKRNNELKQENWGENNMQTRQSNEGSLTDFITDMSQNVNNPERVASLLAGGALVGYGLKQGGVLGKALSVIGGGMLLRGATGHSYTYHALGIDTNESEMARRSPFGKRALSGKVHITKAVTINKSPAELYQFWHNFENLPQFMKHLESVSMVNEERSHWKAASPIGDAVEWDAEITDDVLNEKIGWKSIEGADIPNSGTVQFRPTVNRGTEVKVDLTYEAPGGKLGSMFAKLFGEEPEQQIADDLKRFKRLMETGMIITVKGQTSGREEMPKARAARA